MNLYPWLILWIPFFAAAIIFFGGIKSKISSWLATAGIFSGFVLTLCLLKEYLAQGGEHFLIESSLTWIALGNIPIEFGVLVNGLSLLMLLIVTGVGTLIFIYSASYMKDDKGYARYFASLSMFAFSMLGIVLSNNLIQTFIFWELVGLSSYLLIGFWFEKKEAATAGKKAFITTRVGDVGMMIGILLLFGLMSAKGLGSFNFLVLEKNLAGAAIPATAMTAIGILIFFGVAGKSAQIPLHVWLPDAMEGPTPVSALIHAATMVASGIFLLTRLFFLFEASPAALQMIAWIGIITAIIPATIAFAQNDIKKILAYSTLSQLGLMVLALGLKSPEAGMFHLTTHAFFKALLFLGSGSLIHAMHTQDIWDMNREGGLIKKMPVTSITFLIATAALMGIPPLSGYFSKEEILGAVAHAHNPVLLVFSFLAVFCTSFYMTRLCTVVFLSPSAAPAPKKHHHDKHHAHHHGPAHESPALMTVPLITLCVLSVIAGFLPLKSFVSHHAHAAHHAAWLPFVSVGLALAGLVFAFILYRGKKAPAASEQSQAPATFWNSLVLNKYFFDTFYDKVVINFFQENIARVSDWFERVVVVELIVNGLARATRNAGDLLRKLQTGVVQFYALVFAAGVTVILYAIILVKS